MTNNKYESVRTFQARIKVGGDELPCLAITIDPYPDYEKLVQIGFEIQAMIKEMGRMSDVSV